MTAMRCFGLGLIMAWGLAFTAVGQTPEPVESTSPPVTAGSPSATPGATLQPGAPAVSPAPMMRSNEQEQKLTPEQKVLSKMHMVNQMEMKAGEMGSQKGASDDIRSYGDRLFRDHQFGDTKVTGLAKRLGIELVEVKPQTPEEKQQAEAQKQMMEKLKDAQGPEFDREFAKAMKKGHEQVIANLRKAFLVLKNEKVISLVKHLLPILEQHEKLADHLMKEEKANG